MPPQAPVVDDEYGLEPAKSAQGVTDDQYGLEPATKAPTIGGGRQAPTRKPGEARPLSQEEVNKFLPPTQFEKEHTPAPEDTGVWGRTKQFGRDILGMGIGLAQSVPGARTVSDIASGKFADAAMDVIPGADVVRNLSAARQSDIERQKEGRSPLYRAIATPAQAAGLADPTTMEEAARRGDPAGVLVHAGAQIAPLVVGEALRTPAGEKVTGAIGDLAKKAAGKVAEMRAPGRIANFKQTVLDLAGKTPADLDFAEKVDKMTPDVAKVARERAFDEKGNARVGEFPQMLRERGREIWSEEHTPQIEAQGHLNFDSEVPAQRATAALSKQMRADNPAAARAVDRWVASTLNPETIGTVKDADSLMRSLNAANPDVPEPYKNLMRIAKNAAGEAIREQLEAKLQDAGEAGVSGPNSRYGAIKEVADAIENHLNNAANRPLSGWEAIRNAGRTGSHWAWGGAALGGLAGETLGAPGEGAAIGGGLGAAAGTVGSVAHDILQQPGGRIARAMRGLSKTNLQPETVQPGIPRLPFRAGPDVSGPTGTPPGEAVWSDTAPLPTQPNAPVGALPTLSGPVTSSLWGRPIVQPQPGFEVPGQELMGPWGGGTPPTEPPQTVAPMKPPLNFPPKGAQQEPLNFTKPVPKTEQNVSRETIETKPKETKPVTEEKPVPEKSTKGAVEKKGPPTERRTSVRDITGPDFYRTARMNELRKTIADETVPKEDRDLAQQQLDDMKANPFERHEGKDINQVKAMNKPTMTREAAEAATEARKSGRNARFSEQEGVLPGMGEHVAKQAEGAAKVKGEELTAEMNRPRNVDEATGRMETHSELFRGTAASPQGELLKPMEPPKTEAAPKEEEPVETEVKGVTAKEPKPAKAPKAPKPKPIDQRYSRDEILEAEGLLNTESGMMAAGEKPGIYYDEFTEENRPLKQNQNFREGERAGGKWRGVKSGREMQPFMSEHPEWGPEYVQKALRNKDSAAYQKVMQAAIDFLREQKITPEERAKAAEAKFSNFVPPKSKFVNLKKPGE